jgi:hypothetical protein
MGIGRPMFGERKGNDIVKKRNLVSAAMMMAMAGYLGCSSSTSPTGGTGGKNSGGSQSSGGAAGTSSTAKGGTTASGGSIGSGGAATGGSAGTPASGGTTSTSSANGGSSGVDANAATGGSTSVPIDGAGEVSTGGGEADLWFELESKDNTLYHVGSKTCATTCPTEPKEAQDCCHGGGYVNSVLGPQQSYIRVEKVTVPKDGDYDVTWWYHCGGNDNYHDHDCGVGKTPPAWMTYYTSPEPGCRPHIIHVNGTQVVGAKGEQYFQFPCFGDNWGPIHATTTTLAFKAGDNTLQIGAPHIGDLDAADLDAVHVVTAGKGVPPKCVEPTEYAGDGRK